jgi:hypothetical protein
MVINVPWQLVSSADRAEERDTHAAGELRRRVRT